MTQNNFTIHLFISLSCLNKVCSVGGQISKLFGFYSDSPKQAAAAGGARHDVCEAGGGGRGGGDLRPPAHSASRAHSASTISTSVLSHHSHHGFYSR